MECNCICFYKDIISVLIPFFKFLLHLFAVCVCARSCKCTCHSMDTCGSQRATLMNWFSSSTCGLQGSNSAHQAWLASAFAQWATSLAPVLIHTVLWTCYHFKTTWYNQNCSPQILKVTTSVSIISKPKWSN